MIYGSVCSGIEAASAAWHPLGWRAAFLSEIEAFPRAVLAHHYASTPLHGDFTTIQGGQYDPIDILVGGTPCQSFSVAGLRGGMADERGNLALEYLRLADRLRSRWLLWENVPGVLSSNGGRDFGSFLGGLGQLGYGVAYRVLDAQFFGLAQRRKRVFVVGYLGDWRRAAAVLFEPQSLRRDTPPRRQAGQDTTGTLSARASAGGGLGTDFECDGGLIARPLTANKAGGSGGQRYDWETEKLVTAPPLTSNPYGDHESREELLVANTLRVPSHGAAWRGDGCDNLVAHSLRADGFDASEDGTGRGMSLLPVYGLEGGNQGGGGNVGWFEGAGVSSTLHRGGVPGVVQPYTLAIRGRGDGHDLEYRQDGTSNALLTPNGGRGGIGCGAVAFDLAQITSAANRTRVGEGMPASTLNAAGQMHVSARAAVRRLTPVECEKLQGFQPGYTAISYRGQPAADGPRYRALGNSMAVPVMAWIGRRIAVQEADIQAQASVAA